MASCVKEGRLYVGQDPHLGKIRGLDPWAVDNGIHVICITREKTEGIMMINQNNVQQYGTVHGGMLVAFAVSMLVTQAIPYSTAIRRRRKPARSGSRPCVGVVIIRRILPESNSFASASVSSPGRGTGCAPT